VENVGGSGCIAHMHQLSLQKVQGRTWPQGWSRHGRDSTHRQPCGTCL